MSLKLFSENTTQIMNYSHSNTPLFQFCCGRAVSVSVALNVNKLLFATLATPHSSVSQQKDRLAF